MATRPAGLPAKPSTSDRKSRRSASPSVSSSTPNHTRYDGQVDTSASPSTPTLSIKGKYERKASRDASTSLLQQALGAASREPSTPSASTSSPKATTPDILASRAQFEQQEDFISFGEEEPKYAAGTPQRSGGGGKRKNGHEWDEDGRDEGSRKVRKRERERSTPWCDEPGVNWDSCRGPTSMLNAEAHAFITYISPTPIEHELRMWIVELIRRAIKSRWSDADVECFGSVGTGLYLPGGDIDLVVLCPSFPSPPSKPSSSLLHSLASLLLTSSIAEPSSLIVIAKARVPIVKFVTRYGGFSVDLSVNQQNGVDAAVRVRGLLENYAFRDSNWIEPGIPGAKGKEKELNEIEMVDHGVARSLVMLVKAFLNQRGMNEVFTGGLGSYSIICLVVSFLQLHPKIQSGEIHPARNVGLLFQEFNEYYGKHFNYDEAGITLRGKGGYFNKHDKGWWRPQQPYLLSIEDPNDPSNDVSGGSHNIIRVRQTLAGAADCLAATLFQRHSEFSSRSNPAVVPLSISALPNADYDAPSPLCQSVLGSIIGMSREGIRSREENIRLYEAGVLQDLLERSNGGASIGSGKKALKRMRKEEKETARQEKTLAKLEMRNQEREKKEERKEKKKAREAESARAPGAVASMLGLDTKSEQRVVESVAQRLFTTNTATSKVVEEESESRYSIADSSRKSKSVEVIFVESDDSSMEGESDEDNLDVHDDDVIIGGTGGDQLTGGRSDHSSSEEEEEDSNDEVLRSLVMEGRAEVMIESVVVSSGKTKAEKKIRKDKIEAKTAFWRAKSGKKIEVLDLSE